MKDKLTKFVVIMVVLMMPISAMAFGKPPFPGGGPLDLLEELGLSDEKIVAIHTQTLKHRRAGRKVQTSLMELMPKLEEEVIKENPDPKKIEELKKEINAAHSKMVDIMIEGATFLKGQLTPEQFSKIRELRKKKFERFGKMKGRRGPRPLFPPH